MNIAGIDSLAAVKSADKKKEKKNRTGSKEKGNKTSFISILNKTTETSGPLPLSDSIHDAEDLDRWLEKLEEYEQNLAERPTRYDFNRYRDHVRKIARYALDHAYKHEFIRDKKQREYEVIRVINKDLEEIYLTLLRRNTGTVVALHLMGEIRGIILDLLG